jgi:hypothetical protein
VMSNQGGQFRRVMLWQCYGCKRYLKTERGIERHKTHCVYRDVPLDGQMEISEFEEVKYD